MNLLIPSAPTAAHGMPGAGEDALARREVPDGDFAAALAETLGDVGDDVGGDEPKIMKPEDAGNRSRVVRRIEMPSARGRQNGEVPVLRNGPSIEVVGTTEPRGVRRSEEKAPAQRVEPGEPREAPVAAVGPEPLAVAAAVRDVLAVLTPDLAARSERAAPPEFAATVRKATGATGADLDTRRTDKADGSDRDDGAEVAILPVRVVRQEKHFQPAGVEARLWQIAQDSVEGARPASAPALVPDAAKPSGAEIAQRERPVASAALARAPEAAAPVVASISPAGELSLGGVGVQIADRVQQALGTPPGPGEPPPSPAEGGVSDTRQTFAPALRTIKLQLNPAELGTVTIVLSGSDEGLRIELAAELADTVTKVENDRGVLAARLNGAGYAVTEVTVARLTGQAMESDAREQGARQGGAQEQVAGNTTREGGAQLAGQQTSRQFARRPPDAGVRPGPSQGAPAAPVLSGVSYAGRFRPV
ncbi:MAG: flagellar hook-length control protein FliK [Hyphomicrobiaceae bacterium]